MNPVNRWWIYQEQRFPVVKHGVVIAVFSSSAVFYSSILRGATILPSAGSVLVAFVAVFVFFLALRVADEFKDYEDDLRYRAHRPVPSGLVSLRELAGVAAIGGIIQVGLCIWLDARLVLPLLVTWAYLALMSKEFLLGERLKKHPVLYMLSHMVIMPLIVLCATACDWRVSGNGAFPAGMAWFIAVSYFTGIVLEIGRKIRAPEDETFGVDTYTTLCGTTGAGVAWLAALSVSCVFACLAGREIAFFPPVAVVSILALVWAAFVSYQFMNRPSVLLAKSIEDSSGYCIIAIYLILGVVPLLLGRWDG